MGILLQNDISNKIVFKKAIVAAAFSPSLHAVMNEAHHLLKMLGVWPVIVHVGEDNASTRNRLEEEIDRTNFKNHPPIFLVRSGPPAEVLAQAAAEQNADLIVAGALKKERGFKYYMGSIARSLARNATCSVLLFTDPQTKPLPIDRIHCAVDYEQEDEYAINIAAGISHWAKTKDLYFTHSFKKQEWQEKKQVPNVPEEIKETYKNEDEQLKKFLKRFDFYDKEYFTRTLYDKNRAATLSFTREIQSDLLIVTGQKNRLGLWDRVFPQELELALQDLPCSILITKRPNQNNQL
jgi:nucleotide-binding universal stress UspA family protein